MTSLIHPPSAIQETPIVKVNPLTAVLRGSGTQPLLLFENGWRQHGNMFRLQIGPRQLNIVSHPDYAHEILVNQRDQFHKPGVAPRGDLLSIVLGQGLITNYDRDSWLSQRRMMQPMFHRKRLQIMSEKMQAAGGRMLSRWASLPTDQPVDITDEMMTVTMDIITETLFSTNILDRAQKLGHSVGDALHFAFARRGIIQLPLWLPTPANRKFKQAIQTLDETVYWFIDQRLAENKSYDDLLSMLIEARDEETGEGMSRLQLRDEVTTFFGAGHETTSNALSWALFLLARHPEIMTRLQAEVDGVLNGRLPGFDDLPNLPYTKMVLEEAMRLYAPAPIIPRYTLEETQVGGLRVPADTLSLISVWNIHRHPDFWDAPEQFQPERFAPEATKARHRMAYMPFGGGQRMCIGNNFAMIEGQMLLAMMIQTYAFELDPAYEPELDLAITLRPGNGLPMRLRRR